MRATSYVVGGLVLSLSVVLVSCGGPSRLAVKACHDRITLTESDGVQGRMQSASDATVYPLTSPDAEGDPRNAYSVHTWYEAPGLNGAPSRRWYRCETTRSAVTGDWVVLSSDETPPPNGMARD